MTRPHSISARGPISWMARHSVAANLLMLVMVLGGLFMSTTIKQEVFPSFDIDTVTVSVSLPGGTPAEVEQSIVLVIEEQLNGIEGIKEITATASEGSGSVVIELDTSANRQGVYDEIRQAVDRITTFPDDAEQPSVRLNTRRREVVEMQLYGDVDEWSLRQAAEHVRDTLLQKDGISQVDLSGIRDFEIILEVRQETLRAHGITLSDVATIVRQAALDRSGGTVETSGGSILLRVSERRDWAREFEQIPVLTTQEGVVLRLGDIAEVREGFEDTTVFSTFNGLPSIRLNVYRVGDETPISVSDAVAEALPLALSALPEAVSIAVVDDDAEVYKARLDLLLKNGLMGLILVLVVLSMFLEFKLAFWVAVGIPTAFLGTLLFLPAFDASINMVSLFAFILALGIVVDDAIVAGENIYEYMQRGMTRLEAAIQGARDIAMPLSFSILTNIVAFLPLAMMPGGLGKFWLVIPIVVASAFILSWVEALFVLPAHLANTRRRPEGTEPGPLARVQMAISGAFEGFIRKAYAPTLRLALHWRYTTAALMVALMMLALAWPLSGRMGFGFFPSVERDFARVYVTMPVGTPADTLKRVRDRYIAAANRVVEQNGGEDLATGIYAYIDGNQLELRLYLQPPEVRPLATTEVTRLWRQETGEVASVRSSRFDASFGGPGGGSGVEVQLTHSDVRILSTAAADLARRLEEFGSVRDVEDGFTPGKVQLEFSITEAGRALGLTADEVARQVRSAFFGAEALKQQRGRNEVTVRVRLPESERSSEADVENLILAVPGGGEAPLYEVATVKRSRAPASITREMGRRAVTVSANVTPEEETNLIVSALTDSVLPQLQADYPGLGYGFTGRQQSQRETMESFVYSITLALIVIYALLAVPLRSYVQPLIVMTAIPFGVVGAVLGHLLMDTSLSVISIMGAIALGGVVINSALVMLVYAHDAHAAGASRFESIWQAGVRRFRPIILTTFTTFGGLAPMIFETSRQAKFLIPMAISLGYGILFATLIVLFFVPALYLIIDDVRRLANPEPDPITLRGGRPPEGGAPDRVAAE